jgi:hypothetical protein
MFGIQNIVVLPRQRCNNIILFERSSSRYLNILTLTDGWLDDPLQWLRGYAGLNFEKMFRYFVFGFADDVKHQLLPAKDYLDEIEALFANNSLIRGKTVVLSPYSNTLFDLPEDLLDSLVVNCKKLGYKVCTNCVGTEKPVKGTNPIFFPLDQAIAFMNAAGYFIGVRSGLCDIISSSHCKKVIFYDKNGLFFNSSQYNYFSIVKMGLCDDAIEIEYDDDIKEECLNKILNFL